MSDRNQRHELTKRAFAELFGLSEKQIERYCQAGMPHRKKGTKVSLPMPEAREWYKKHLVQKGREEAQPTDRSQSIDRQEAAAAAIAEIDLAKARNETMTVEEHVDLLADAFARVKSRLVNLPPRIAGVVLGAQTIQEAQARIEPVVREAMEELRRADDVPGTEDNEDAAA